MVEELTAPANGDVVSLVVAAAVAPGVTVVDGGTDRLSLPSTRAIKVEEVQLDGRKYTYLQFPSETVTNSGYSSLTCQRRYHHASIGIGSLDIADPHTCPDCLAVVQVQYQATQLCCCMH